MTVIEIANYCCKTVGDISADMLDYAKDAIRLKYKTLYDSHSWRESMRLLEVQPVDPSQGGSIFLPFDAEEVIFLSLSWDGVNFRRLLYRDLDWIERTHPGRFSLPGNIPWYYRAENLGWPAFNPGHFIFTTYDLTPSTVYIQGKDSNGTLVAEQFTMVATLSGSNVVPETVTTESSFDTIFYLSKTGDSTVVVTSDASTEGLVMKDARQSAVFSQFVLYPVPVFTDSSNHPIPLYYQTLVKLKADSIDDDMSVPRISHIWDALVEFTLSSLYTRARQLTKADAREAKAIAHIQAAVNVEKNQSESRQQVIPIIYDSGDYLEYGKVMATSSYPFG